MKKKKFILLFVVLSVLLYDFYIFKDGDYIVRKTNLLESDNITVNYSKGMYHPYNSTLLTTQQTAELSGMLSELKLKRQFKNGYGITDSHEECSITVRDSLVDNSVYVISVVSGEAISIHKGFKSEYYRLTNPESTAAKDIYSYVSLLIRNNTGKQSIAYNFELTTDFPEGWQFVKRENSDNLWENNYPMINMDEVHDIYNEENIHIGALGLGKYNCDADSLWKRYSPIALPNLYHFVVPPQDDLPSSPDFYHCVKKYEYGETALTKVYHSPQIQNNTDQTRSFYNNSILCYNDEKLMFVAMEFDPEYTDDRLMNKLANSTEITDVSN